MNKILKQLKLDMKTQDMMTDLEQQQHEHILNTFEHIAEQNTHKSMKYVLAIAADELNMTPEELVTILDEHYQSEDEDEEPRPKENRHYFSRTRCR